ncbi:tRNA lysidine(34) synthetase TilS [Mycoplasmopsis agalactiae]|nr:tRNA lysidine(34) synthetase TilS [Mycoplasmopsis agalactiae]MCE6091152.1 tRNA lysidine(34) synthetase TilS [Mycoplasmopsis agalactiae]
MILLGVSGGPDSMYLLDLISSQRSDIVVATVNYNIRQDSAYDAEIVRKFCEDKGLIFEYLEIDQGACFKGNFEKWAREQRFSFFKKIYEKYNCEALYLAHHKDDFLESYFMQKESKRQPDFFGIKTENYIYGMKVVRPLVDIVFKNEILEALHNKKIKYANDYTNDLPIYTRNRIRIWLKSLSNSQKSKIFDDIQKENNELAVLEQDTVLEYEHWKKAQFSQDEFLNLSNKERLVYKFVHENYVDIKLSDRKIKSIISFILSNNRTSQYLIKNNVFIQKKHGKLVF